MLYLPITPLLARHISMHSTQSYGNGNSYFFKTDVFKRYLNDCSIDIGLKLENVPIKKYLVHSILIEDFLSAAKKWNISYQFNRPEYYWLNYKETLSRKSYKVDVREELAEFWRALNTENFYIKSLTYFKIFPIMIKSFFYRPYRFLEKYEWFADFMLKIRKTSTEIKYVYYDDALDCAMKTTCLIPNWNDKI
jgi:hypothetical protein